MNLTTLTNTMLPAIETRLEQVIALLDTPRTRPFHEMLTYHMGWSGEGAGPEAQGKRIRPLLILLAAAASGETRSQTGTWQSALPAAAAVELIHNFSLVHDDIQDKSDLRRGHPTVWKKWGEAHAVNAGDALFILAHHALLGLHGKFPAEMAMTAGGIIHEACLRLTSGQFLDMSYESRDDISIEDYWPMVTGKTAALLAACTEIGALLGGADEADREAYRGFGNYLGLAFQIQDDYLGIWGNSALTGKSSQSDLLTGKKSLPVLFGLEKKGAFWQRWSQGPVIAEEVPGLADQLASEGAKLYTQEMADQMTDLALSALRAANPQGEAGEALFELTHQLLNRET